jgi:TP901 family phage tail tape measure protein
VASNTRNEEIKYLFESKAIGIDEVIKLLEGTKEKSHEAATAFEFLQDHLKEIISIAAAAELALKGVEFGKESLKNAEDVEVSLSRVRALAKDASDQFGDMGEAVEKAAQAVNVSSQESAGGLAALVSQGLSAKDAIAALVPTLQLAKIANIDVGTAVGEVAAALKAFNVPAADAQKVVDELTAASHGAAGGLGAMSAAATQLAPDAKALHLSFTDVVSVLGVLNEKGIDSEKSVRGLRTVFQELQDPTSKLRGELLALGDGTSDFDKAIAALSSGSPRANQALLSITGGARTVVEALGQSGPDAIRKFSDALERQNGIAAKTAQILDDNLKGASTRFSLAIENIGEKLAKPVLEPFAKELEKLAGELNKFADSPDFEEIQKSIGDMAKNAAEAIDTLIHGIDWKTFLADGKDALGTIADKLKGVADTAGAVATGINDVFAAIGGVYHVLGTAVDGAVSSFAKAGDGITSIAEKMLALDVGGDRAARAMEGLHNAFESVGGEATEQATAHLHAAGDDLKYLAGGADKLLRRLQRRTALRPRKPLHISNPQADALAKAQAEFHRLAVAAAAAHSCQPLIDAVSEKPAKQRKRWPTSLRLAADSSKAMTGDVKTAFAALNNIQPRQESWSRPPPRRRAAFALIDKSAAKLGRSSGSRVSKRQRLLLSFCKGKSSLRCVSRPRRRHEGIRPAYAKAGC